MDIYVEFVDYTNSKSRRTIDNTAMEHFFQSRLKKVPCEKKENPALVPRPSIDPQKRPFNVF